MSTYLHANEVRLICVPNELNARNRFECPQCLIDIVMLFFCMICTKTHRNNFVWPTLWKIDQSISSVEAFDGILLTLIQKNVTFELATLLFDQLLNWPWPYQK